MEAIYYLSKYAYEGERSLNSNGGEEKIKYGVKYYSENLYIAQQGLLDEVLYRSFPTQQ